MKLKTKLFWVVFISVFVGVFALNGVLTMLGSLLDDGYEPNQLKQVSMNMQAYSLDQPAATVPEILHVMSERYPGLLFDWFDPRGRLLFTTNPEKNSYETGELLSRFANIPPGESNLSKVFELTLQGANGFLIVTALPDHVRSQYALVYFKDEWVFVVYLLPIVLFLFAPALAAVLLTISITRRIHRLNRAMQATDLNRMSLSLNDRSRDEIGQLTRLFMEMSAKIRNQFEQLQQVEQERRNLVSSLSHNLRTPLTSVIGYADSINRELYRSPKERRQWISIIVSRSLYMERLLKQLFQVSLSSDGSETLTKVRCDLCELVREIVVEYAPLLEDKGLDVQIRIPEDELYLLLNAAQMEQAIRNLLDNAITYGAGGGFIGISVETSDNRAMLSVTDRGSGIPEKEQALVFKRFYRSGGDVGYSGAGLGLSFVEEVALAHDGHVRLSSVPNVKTVFTIVLPC